MQPGAVARLRTGSLGLRGSPLKHQLDVVIKNTRSNDTGDVFYVVKVTEQQTGKNWEVQRRYSDFVSLGEALAKRHADRVLPPLPRKHMFTSKSSQVIAERVQGLGTFIQQVAFVTKMCNDQLVRNFLCVEDSSDELEARLSAMEDDVRRSSKDLMPQAGSEASPSGRERSLSSAEKIKQHREFT